MKKAEIIAEKFRRDMLKKKDPEVCLKLIVRDLIREANDEIMKKKLQTAPEIASVFEKQCNKWNKMQGLLSDFPIQYDGFLMLLKKFNAPLYFKLIQCGLTRLQEDFEPQKEEQNGSKEL